MARPTLLPAPEWESSRWAATDPFPAHRATLNLKHTKAHSLYRRGAFGRLWVNSGTGTHGRR
jgi:hypothetical protein